MSYNLRNKNYPNRPARYCDSDWVTEFPRPHFRYSIRYSLWIEKLIENEKPLGEKPKMIGLFHDGWASSDEEEDEEETANCYGCCGIYLQSEEWEGSGYCSAKCYDRAETRWLERHAKEDEEE